MNRRVIAALIGVFAVGALIGVVIALATQDSNDSAPTPSSSEEDCAAARAVVAAANDSIADINAADSVADASFFAAVLAEQRTITFAMDAEPTCFALAERASAEGLLDGIRALVAVAELNPGGPVAVPVPDIGDVQAPEPDEAPPAAPPTTLDE